MDEKPSKSLELIKTIEVGAFERARRFLLDVWTEDTAPRYVAFTVAVGKITATIEGLNSAVLFHRHLPRNVFYERIKQLSPRLASNVAEYKNTIAELTGETETTNKLAMADFVEQVQQAVETALAGDSGQALMGLFDGKENEDYIKFLATLDYGGRPKKAAIQWIRSRAAYHQEYTPAWGKLKTNVGRFDYLLKELASMEGQGLIADETLLAYDLMKSVRVGSYAKRGEKYRDWIRK